MMMWKIVRVSKVSVLYIYIYIYRLLEFSHIILFLDSRKIYEQSLILMLQCSRANIIRTYKQVFLRHLIIGVKKCPKYIVS